MENVSVTYIKTDLKKITNNIQHPEDLEANHCLYIYPFLTADLDSKTAFFTVNISTQFEGGRNGIGILPFLLTTESDFVFEKFVKHEDRYEILKDYIFFAFNKHVSILEEKIPNEVFSNKINRRLNENQYKSSIEGILW